MNITFENGVIKTPDVEFEENCGGIGNIYFESFKRFKERVAMINATTEEYWTYSEFLKNCIRAALVLQKQGYKKQDLLAICSNKENFKANALLIAGQFLGLITYSIDPSLTVAECTELLELVQPDIIFVTEKARDKITTSLKTNETKIKLILFGKSFEDEYFKYQEGEDSFDPVLITNLQDTCVIHFSSGTTGLPKPICLNHYYFLRLRHTLSHLYQPQERNKKFANHPLGQVSLRFANWYWVSTSFEMITYIPIGGCRIFWDSFDAKEIWNHIEKFSVTNLLLTPLQCIELTSRINPNGRDISSVTDISSGGSALHNDYFNILRRTFQGAHIYQLYGMTECGVAATFRSNIPEHLKFLVEKPNSCGLPTSGLCFKVIDMKTGKKCGPNQPGELYIKGKGILNGFYKKDYSETFDNEGYFRTGDLLSFDEDYCFFVVDRIKAILC